MIFVDIFIHKDGRQSGPFPLVEVIEKASTGALSPSDLAWHEGIPSWVPLSEILQKNKPLSLPVPPPVPFLATTSVPGLVSFGIELAGFPAWLAILVAAAIFHNQGMGSQNPKMVLVGLGLFAMLGLNAIGGILGLVTVFNKCKSKTLSILGISFNFLQIAGIILLMIIGLAARK